MKSNLGKFVALALGLGLATETFAEEWNVSTWGKRRAFTEHIEKLAELVSAKTNGEFTMNVSYGGLSKNRENLDGISIGAFEMAQFCAGYHRDKNRAINVLELPFLGVETLNFLCCVLDSSTSACSIFLLAIASNCLSMFLLSSSSSSDKSMNRFLQNSLCG